MTKLHEINLGGYEIITQVDSGSNKLRGRFSLPHGSPDQFASFLEFRNYPPAFQLRAILIITLDPVLLLGYPSENQRGSTSIRLLGWLLRTWIQAYLGDPTNPMVTPTFELVSP